MVFLSLTRPSKAMEDATCRIGSERGFNYPHVGATASCPPLPAHVAAERWTVDHSRIQVGKGRKAYENGKRALEAWDHFQLGWTYVDPSTPVRKDSNVCVVARAFVPWTRNPLRIVNVKEESRRGGKNGFGEATAASQVFTFAHGCLGGHLLAGEERFSVEWNREDDSVWYEVYTFSKPAHPLATVSYPAVRFLQKKFASDSSRAMKAAVGGT